MAKVLGRPTVTLNVCIEFTEQEARALDALTVYGDDEFIKTFKENLGKSYLEPWEDGLRSLFTSIRSTLPGYFAQASNARAAFHKNEPK